MTDKQQIIEEMVDVMAISCGECYSCQFSGKTNNRVSCIDYLTALALYNAGYRNVKDYELVVSLNILGEEWEKIKNECLERVEYNITEIQKQTAKAIFTKLIEVAKNNDNKLSIGLLKAWAIEYGVEVNNE